MVYLGQDISSETFYSGQVALVRMNFGTGAYKKDNQFSNLDKDPFAFDLGLRTLKDDEAVKPAIDNSKPF